MIFLEQAHAAKVARTIWERKTMLQGRMQNLSAVMYANWANGAEQYVNYQQDNAAVNSDLKCGTTGKEKRRPWSAEEMTSDGTDDPRSEMMTGSNDQTNQARSTDEGNAKYEVLGGESGILS